MSTLVGTADGWTILGQLDNSGNGVAFMPRHCVFIGNDVKRENAVEVLKDRLGFKNAFDVASSVGRAGGLCIYLREETKFTLVSFSQNHTCGDIESDGKFWRFVGTYGWSKEKDKYKTWN